MSLLDFLTVAYLCQPDQRNLRKRLECALPDPGLQELNHEGFLAVVQTLKLDLTRLSRFLIKPTAAKRVNNVYSLRASWLALRQHYLNKSTQKDKAVPRFRHGEFRKRSAVFHRRKNGENNIGIEREGLGLFQKFGESRIRQKEWLFGFVRPLITD